jgi:hypothetical protein
VVSATNGAAVSASEVHEVSAKAATINDKVRVTSCLYPWQAQPFGLVHFDVLAMQLSPQGLPALHRLQHMALSELAAQSGDAEPTMVVVARTNAKSRAFIMGSSLKCV